MSRPTRPDSAKRFALSFVGITSLGVLLGYSVWSLADLMRGEPLAWSWQAEGLVMALSVPAALTYERWRQRRRGTN